MSNDDWLFMGQWVAFGFAGLLALFLAFCFRRRSNGLPFLPFGNKDILSGILSPQTAARRALCLLGFAMRASFEEASTHGAYPSPDEPVGESERSSYKEQSDDTNEWLKREGLWRWLSPLERSLMQLPFGIWNRQAHVDGMWRIEAFGALAWALQLRETFPQFDSQMTHLHMLTLAEQMKPMGHFVRNARLRPSPEILKARDTAELWHWRARTHQLSQKKAEYNLPEGWAIEKIITTTAELAEKDGSITAIERDFPAFGKPYRHISDDEWSVMNSIARERQYALNWLCGSAEDWDRVRTDT